MSDSSSNNFENPKDEGTLAFNRLLKVLCLEDPEEAGRHYIQLHRKLVGYFRFRGSSDPDADADETLDRAARKLLAGANVPDVQKYCFGIARYIVMERLREKERSSSAFLQFVEGQDRSIADQVDWIMRFLKPCFEQLSKSEQDLLRAYCAISRGRARAEHRRQLAKGLKFTVSALRIRVTRLRRDLDDCVKTLASKA